MQMTATILDITPGRSLLVVDEATGQQVVVNTRNTNRFSINDRIRITYNGVMTRSMPPQITANNIQILNPPRPPARPPVRPPVAPVPPIGVIPRPPVSPVPPIGILPAPREMRARVVRREPGFLIVQNNANGQVLRADTPNARFFCPGAQVIIRNNGIVPGLPPRVIATDIVPNC